MRRRTYLAATTTTVAGLSGCIDEIESVVSGDECGPGSDEIETVYDNWDTFEEEISTLRGEIVAVTIDADDFGTVFSIDDTTGTATIIPTRDNVDDVHDLESGMCVNVTGRVPSTDSGYYIGGTSTESLVIIGASWTYIQ